MPIPCTIADNPEPYRKMMCEFRAQPRNPKPNSLGPHKTRGFRHKSIKSLPPERKNPWLHKHDLEVGEIGLRV